MLKHRSATGTPRSDSSLCAQPSGVLASQETLGVTVHGLSVSAVNGPPWQYFSNKSNFTFLLDKQGSRN